jgi:hypothetical protein
MTRNCSLAGCSSLVGSDCVANDHIYYDLAGELLDVARHNQVKIFDLERQVPLRVIERLPELEDFAGSDGEEQEKIIGSCGVTER